MGIYLHTNTIINRHNLLQLNTNNVLFTYLVKCTEMCFHRKNLSRENHQGGNLGEFRYVFFHDIIQLSCDIRLYLNYSGLFPTASRLTPPLVAIYQLHICAYRTYHLLNTVFRSIRSICGIGCFFEVPHHHNED